MDIRRVLPLSGIAFVVIALVAVIGIGGDTPTSGDTPQSMFDFYNDETVRQAIASFVFAASVPFIVFFAVSLAAAFRERGAESSHLWRQVVVAGGVLTGAGILANSWIHFALADGADNGVSPTAIETLVVLDSDSWVAFNAALGVMMLGAAGCLIPTGGRFMGWSALVLGVALFIPFADFFALLLTLIWIIVASIVLYRETSAQAQTPLAPV